MCSIAKTLVVRASGGLSNRLQAVICGLAYCLLTERAICVDWRDGLYSDDFSNVFPLWFSVDKMQSIAFHDLLTRYQNGSSIHPPFWQDWIHEPIAIEYMFATNEHATPSNREKTSIKLEDINRTEDILIFWDWSIKAMQPLIPKLKAKFTHLANVDDADIPRYLLKKYLRPLPSIVNEVDNFFIKHFESPPVGIHIRHTDLQSPIPNLLNKLRELVANDKVFLCTDNAQVEKMVCRLFPRTVVRNKIYQGTNVPLHSYVEGISNVQKGYEAILDMLILARCKHIIHYDRSSFARISTLFSELDSSHIHSVSA